MLIFLLFKAYCEDNCQNNCGVTIADEKKEKGQAEADEEHNVNPKGDQNPVVGAGDRAQGADKHEGNQTAEEKVGEPTDQENHLKQHYSLNLNIPPFYFTFAIFDFQLLKMFPKTFFFTFLGIFQKIIEKQKKFWRYYYYTQTTTIYHLRYICVAVCLLPLLLLAINLFHTNLNLQVNVF